jgi:hypothetical protein
MSVHEGVVWGVMVVLREVVNRHVAYVLACACVAALGEMPFLCTALLSAIAGGLRWHTQNTAIFYVLSAFLFAAVEVVTMAVAVNRGTTTIPCRRLASPCGFCRSGRSAHSGRWTSFAWRVYL